MIEAAAMESEAVLLYVKLEAEMGRQGADDVAAVFHRLVAIEQLHVGRQGGGHITLFLDKHPSALLGLFVSQMNGNFLGQIFAQGDLGGLATLGVLGGEL